MVTPPFKRNLLSLYFISPTLTCDIYQNIYIILHNLNNVILINHPNK
jgi:hypothetical protein